MLDPGMRYVMPPDRSWPPGCFLCTTSSTLRELPVAGVNLLSAQDARIEIGGGGAQIRGSGSSGLAAQPQSRRCSECCDSIHPPPAGHIYLSMCTFLLKGPSTRSRCAGNWGSSEPGELRASANWGSCEPGEPAQEEQRTEGSTFHILQRKVRKVRVCLSMFH